MRYTAGEHDFVITAACNGKYRAQPVTDRTSRANRQEKQLGQSR